MARTIACVDIFELSILLKRPFAIALGWIERADSITYDGGLIHLPDAPGHGADVEDGILERLDRVSIAA